MQQVRMVKIPWQSKNLVDRYIFIGKNVEIECAATILTQGACNSIDIVNWI